MTALTLSNLTKRYSNTTAVSSINVSIDRGEVFGFIGPNGAGKSTTIGMMLDYIHPTDGSVTVLGYDAQSEQRTIREQVGILPENAGLFRRKTGIEHLRFALDTHDDPRTPHELLERVGLTEAGHDRVDTYSTGMAQRLRLAIALVGEPQLLILDEPASGLDPGGIRRLSQIVSTEQERGAAVFFSSHVLDQVRSVCDRVGVLVDGELVAIEPVEATTDQSTILRIDVSDGSTAVEDALSSHDTVSSLSVTETGSGITTIRVTLTTPEGNADVLRQAEAAGRVVDFSIEEDPLESLYVRLTEEHQ